MLYLRTRFLYTYTHMYKLRAIEYAHKLKEETGKVRGAATFFGVNLSTVI